MRRGERVHRGVPGIDRGTAFRAEPDDALPGRTFVRDLFAGDGINVLEVRGVYRPYPWTAASISERWALVLPRGGMYHRRCDGVEHVVDVNTGFMRRPGQETSIANPAGLSDELTIIDLDESVLDGVPSLVDAAGPVRITPQVSLCHRLLRSCVTSGADSLGVEAAVGDVLSAVLGGGADRLAYGRPSTELTHRRVVMQTCELLNVAPANMSLAELARHVAVSPFHLTKIFRRVTGMTISQYRARLRVHAVLERISAGDDDLSSIAASTGFADHSHMTRTVVAQLGHTPSDLRRLLRRAVPGDQPALTPPR